MAVGGEVLVTKMPTLRIEDLAKVMIKELAPLYNFKEKDINVDVIGVKAGEKMYEELLNEEEIRRTIELDNYFSIIPAFNEKSSKLKYDYKNIKKRKVNKPYISSKEKPMKIKEIKNFLINNNILKTKLI